MLLTFNFVTMKTLSDIASVSENLMSILENLIKSLKFYTVDGFIFVGTNFCGYNKIDTFVGFKILGHSICLHNSYRKSLIRGYWNSWIGPSTKTTKIGTPRKLSHPQYCKVVALMSAYLLTYLFIFSDSIPRNALRGYQESVTTGQTDRQTDTHTQTDAEKSDPYVPLCFAGDTINCIKFNLFVIHVHCIPVWYKMPWLLLLIRAVLICFLCEPRVQRTFPTQQRASEILRGDCSMSLRPPGWREVWPVKVTINLLTEIIRLICNIQL